MSTDQFSEIIKKIENNDCNLRVVDLSKQSLSLENLEKLKTAIQNNNIVSDIIWHKSQSDDEIKNSITEKIFQNAIHHSPFPSDLEYGLLSLHAYEKNTTNGNNVTLSKPEYNSILEHWKVNTVYNNETNGYFGILYKKKQSCQYVLAHRGTDFDSLLEGHKDMTSNIKGIVLNKIVTPMYDVYNAVNESIALAKENGYHLSFTGHSLGAWSAELSIYFAHKNFNYIKTRAVTFDSPGSREAFKKFEPNVPKRKFNYAMLDITTYLAVPNIVNSCNSHIGTVFSVIPKTMYEEIDAITKCCQDSYWYRILSFFPRKLGYYLRQILSDYWFEKLSYYFPKDLCELATSQSLPITTLFGHRLESIMTEFNLTTGIPTQYKEAYDWPCLMCKYKEYKDHISSWVPRGIRYITNIMPGEISDSPVYEFFNLLIGIDKGEIDLGQFRSAINHKVSSQLNGDYKKDDPENNFYSEYEGHYDLRDPNPYVEVIVKHEEYTLQWYLWMLYECKDSLESILYRHEFSNIFRNVVLNLTNSIDVQHNKALRRDELNSAKSKKTLSELKQVVQVLDDVFDEQLNKYIFICKGLKDSETPNIDKLKEFDLTRNLTSKEHISSFLTEDLRDLEESILAFVNGSEFFRKQKYKEAFENFERAANKNNMGAAFWCGVMYHYGFYVKQNYTTAIHWYNKSAEGEYPFALNNLGVMYFNGEGVKRNLDQGIEYWNKSGSPHALENLAKMYERGIVVEKNLTKSEELYTKAKELFERLNMTPVDIKQIDVDESGDYTALTSKKEVFVIAQNMLNSNEKISIDKFKCLEGDRIDLSKTEIPNYDALRFEEDIVAKWSVHYNEKEILVLDHVREESLASECFIFGSSDAAQEEL